MDTPTIEYLLSETRLAYAAVTEAARIKPHPGSPKWDHWQDLIAQANELNAALLQELETQPSHESSYSLSAW